MLVQARVHRRRIACILPSASARDRAAFRLRAVLRCWKTALLPTARIAQLDGSGSPQHAPMRHAPPRGQETRLSKKRVSDEPDADQRTGAEREHKGGGHGCSRPFQATQREPARLGTSRIVASPALAVVKYFVG